MIEASDEMASKNVEENDKYMQQKVAAQLDRLIGKGNYVVNGKYFPDTISCGKIQYRLRS